MKKVVVCLILLSAVLVSGSEIIMPSINCDFAENGRFWVPITSGNGKVNFSGGIMELSRNDGASYADAGNSRQNVSFLPGDKIKLTFSAKGEGWVSAGFRMSSSGNVTKRFKLTSEFSRCNFTVDTAKLKLPENGIVKFIIVKDTSKVWIKTCKVTITRIAKKKTPVQTFTPMQTFTPVPLPSGIKFPERLFYLGTNLLVDASLPKIAAIADRAAKAGYNTVLLADWKFGQPWVFGERYIKRIREVAAMLRARKLRIIVSVCQLADPTPFMNECPEEVECLPSLGTPFKVVNGVFTPQDIMRNGSFENGLENWRLDKGTDIALDDKVSISGKNSLRFRVNSPKDTPLGMNRAWHKFKTQPFQQYTMSFKLKTSGLKGPGPSFGIGIVPVGNAPDQPDGFRYLCARRFYTENPVASTQDWKEYKLTFNSLECREVSLAIGGWGTAGGTFWFDDIQIKPSSFLNVVRRGDTPVKVRLAKDGTICQEGKDYSPIVDPKCGNVKWKGDFSDRHAGPVIRILPGSRIKECDTVKVDYYHAAMALHSVCICLNSPKLRPLIERQIRWLQEAIRPEGMLIGIDEHRTYGYDPACVKSGINAGTALRNMAIFTRNKIREIAPQASIYMWNDMFDPFANCRKGGYYYFIKGRGALYGNHVGLPKDIIIMRWTCVEKLVEKSVAHWSKDMGMKYIHFPGYFDAPVFNPRSRSFMKPVLNDPNCVGVGFAQWSGLNNYKPHFEKFLVMVNEMSAK